MIKFILGIILFIGSIGVLINISMNQWSSNTSLMYCLSGFMFVLSLFLIIKSKKEKSDVTILSSIIEGVLENFSD
jgi:uncharacterized membrane protein